MNDLEGGSKRFSIFEAFMGDFGLDCECPANCEEVKFTVQGWLSSYVKSIIIF